MARLQQTGLPDRATIANMAPEYGATMGFFPVDEKPCASCTVPGAMRNLSGGSSIYQGAGHVPHRRTPDPEFTDTLELDLGKVQPSMAGPKRPQDRILLSDMKSTFEKALRTPIDQRGFALNEEAISTGNRPRQRQHQQVGHGVVVIAAITSCTNTSNPSVMMAAGLLAKKAVERGLDVKPWVKTSLARFARRHRVFRKAGLTPYLEALGFHTVGYGCTTCIGNSGPLPEHITEAVQEGDLVAAAVLSGNRNFEGRINPLVKANYLASPPLVVAYALAGTVDIDLTNEPLATTRMAIRSICATSGRPGRGPVGSEVDHAGMFKRQYGNVYTGNETWNAIPSGSEPYTSGTKHLHSGATVLQRFSRHRRHRADPGGTLLALLGDSITTDHISPAGNIARQPRRTLPDGTRRREGRLQHLRHTARQS